MVNGRTTHILAGSVTLEDDGTARDSYTFRYTDDLEVIEETTHDAGTYTRAGGSVAVTWTSGVVETFSYAGDELTLVDDGYVVRFRR